MFATVVPMSFRRKAGCPLKARRRNLFILIAVSAIWIGLDLAAKTFFNGFAVGQTVAGPFLGIFEFTLVHNTGAAWGVFDQSTLFLGILSLLICALVISYIFYFAPDTGAMQAFGLSLVFAGGIGNAIDRFAYGYVVDFIEPLFIDFPVFNIADIGVTCGVVIFLVAFIANAVRARKAQKD